MHYDHYGERYGKDGLHETLDWKECEEEVEKFQKAYILQHMVDTEISEQTYLFYPNITPYIINFI